ncbi:hypothetical protein Pla133_23270 [Planctomycetes bacterium Pla133]|uniref:Uncharacterized protein n=1 Tax=Engelhardtia mirabilis TaxID=2528011 RepID=A0A518BJU4_9BACT|nr:hypothetical protein Pla133_23270 [Planctomycetes bacterium Pla133]
MNLNFLRKYRAPSITLELSLATKRWSGRWHQLKAGFGYAVRTRRLGDLASVVVS